MVASIFERSKAGYSVVNGGICPYFDFNQAFRHIIITCKYEKDPLKTSRDNVMTSFFPIIRQCDCFTDAKGQLTP